MNFRELFVFEIPICLINSNLTSLLILLIKFYYQNPEFKFESLPQYFFKKMLEF